MKKTFSLIKKFLPWIIAGAVFFFLFSKYPPAQVWKAFSYVNPLIFVPYAILYFLFVLMVDSWSLTWVVNRFGTPVSMKELVPARVVSYLLSVVNYIAGQAGFAYFLKRTKNASFFKILGIILLIFLIDLSWVVLFAFIGSFFVKIKIPVPWGILNLSDWVQKIGFLFFIAFATHLIFWRQWVSRLFKLKIRFRFFDWIRGKHLFQTFHQATTFDYLRIAFTRLPIHLAIIGSQYIAIHAFRVSIAFTDVLTTVPVIVWIGTIPVTPGGLGTVQAATVELLKNQIHGDLLTQGIVKPEEILLAISLSCMFANYLLKAIFGTFYLRKMGKKLFHSDETTEISE